MNKALFLDRDGTLIEHIPYLHKPEQVVLIDGVKEALQQARTAGYQLFLFTNQSGVGRGYFPLDDVHHVNARMLDLLGLGKNPFTEICIAPEHPDRPSLYRKPSPRFILEMIAKHHLDPKSSWMIGDTASDWQAGLGANISVAAVKSDLFTPEAKAKTDKLGVPVFDRLLDFVRAQFGSTQ